MRKLVAKLTAGWVALKPAERTRYLLVLGLFSFGAFAMFHALVTSPVLTKANDDLVRVKARVGKMGKKDNAPPVPRLSGRSPSSLAKEVKNLESQLLIQRERLANLEPQFASLDDLEDHQQLRSAITALASISDMEMLKLEQKGVRKEEVGIAPTPERIKVIAAINPYKRPLLTFEARASYRGLMQFLDGLADLPFKVSPVRISVEVKTDAKDGQPPKRQWLEVALDLAL